MKNMAVAMSVSLVIESVHTCTHVIEENYARNSNQHCQQCRFKEGKKKSMFEIFKEKQPFARWKFFENLRSNVFFENFSF